MFQRLEVAMKSPCEEYREILGYLVTQANEEGTSQAAVARQCAMTPVNLNHVLHGRRPPIKDPGRNSELARICGHAELALELQLASDACYAIRDMGLAFRKYMALTICTLERLLDMTEEQCEAIQDMHQRGEWPEDASWIPESLLAGQKVANSLRYWWPPDEHATWEDYATARESLHQRLKALNPDEQLEALIQLRVEDALEWVRERGDLDVEFERLELISRLAALSGVKQEALTQVVWGLAKQAGMLWSDQEEEPPGRSRHIFERPQEEDAGTLDAEQERTELLTRLAALSGVKRELLSETVEALEYQARAKGCCADEEGAGTK